jgi:hypothetical protein
MPPSSTTSVYVVSSPAPLARRKFAIGPHLRNPPSAIASPCPNHRPCSGLVGTPSGLIGTYSGLFGTWFGRGLDAVLLPRHPLTICRNSLPLHPLIALPPRHPLAEHLFLASLSSGTSLTDDRWRPLTASPPLATDDWRRRTYYGGRFKAEPRYPCRHTPSRRRQVSLAMGANWATWNCRT